MTQKSLAIQSVKTKKFKLGSPLVPFVKEEIKSVIKPKENIIIAITSKIVSLSENRVVKKKRVQKTETCQTRI